MRKRLIPIALALLFLILGVGGCRKAGTFLVKEDMPAEADVIVMLQGSVADRVLQCYDLLDAGKSEKLLMVEEGMTAYSDLIERGVKLQSNTARVEDIFLQMGIEQAQLQILPCGARSTLDEAVAVREWLRMHPEIRSLVLVSSPYHLRRSSMIFRAAMKELDQAPAIYCSPSKYTNVRPSAWWRRKEDIQKVLSEYLKLASFTLIERGRLRPPS